jgi:ATP-binding cassette, subfamily B, bacterial PglK
MNPFRTWSQLVEPQARRRWVFQIIFAVFASVVESVGALLFVFLLTNISQPGDQLTLPVLGNLQQRFPGTSPEHLFLYVAIGIGLFFVFRSALVITQSYYQNRLIYDSGVSLSTRLLRLYLAHDYAWHLRRNSAVLIRNAYESVDVIVGYVFTPLVMVASDGLVVLGLMVVLFVKAPLITVIAMVVLGPLVYALLRVLQPRYGAVGVVDAEMTKGSLRALQQGLGGVKDIKLLGVENFFAVEFTRMRRIQARALTARSVMFNVARPVTDSVLILLILAFLAVERLSGGSTQGSLAILGLFAYAVFRMQPAVNRIVTNVGAIRYGAAAVELVTADLAEGDRHRDSAGAGSASPLGLTDRLTVEGVSLTYDGGTRALDGVSLEVSAGESIGIVGPTGCGKTTLIDVITALLRPDAGRVVADGRDVATSARAWQAGIGVVPQTIFLIDDTLRRNIALGMPDESIDEAAVAEAVRLARLGEFVDGLGDGLDTVVGERGVRLSGGQRQRVAIARALYRRPSIVIFDEGTAALDSLTEAELVRELDLLRGTRTIITVAHRLTTVRGCDRIVVMGAGRIVDVGTWDELTVSSEAFRSLAQAGRGRA